MKPNFFSATRKTFMASRMTSGPMPSPARAAILKFFEFIRPRIVAGRSSKFQAPNFNRRRRKRFWNLMFGFSVELGTWNLELNFCAISCFTACVNLPYKIATLLYCFNERYEILLLERAQQPNLVFWSPCGGKLKT